MKIYSWLKLIITLIICLGIGWVGSFFTTPSIATWYQTLNKSFLNPPNWVFAPVWTLLFILMAIAWYLIWINPKQNKKAHLLFVIQLILNLLWSFCFFYLHNPLLALLEIVVLWVFILLTILSFYKISKPAAYLLIPYIAWVSFASILNASLWWLNRI